MNAARSASNIFLFFANRGNVSFIEWGLLGAHGEGGGESFFCLNLTEVIWLIGRYDLNKDRKRIPLQNNS